MQITLISDINQFEQLKDVWNKVYSADRYAQIFLSWSWLRGWLEVTTNNWLILACQPDSNSPYVAFFPLAINHVNKYGVRIYSLLQMGGRPAADYTGFVCLPEYEKEAVKNFANYIQQNLKWDIFKMTEVFDPRLDVFLNCFSQEKFTIQKYHNHSCTGIPLPNTWEQYSQNFMGYKTRKNLRNAFNKIEKNSDLCFVETHVDNLDTQINALFTLWQMQWGKKTQEELNGFRSTFYHCYESNRLRLIILWDIVTKKPIAGSGILVDRDKKIYYGCMTGYNPEFSKLSPGRVMIAYTIQKAIEEKIEKYDFLRGNEEYKFSFFGAKVQHFNDGVNISRTNLRANIINQIKLRKQLIVNSRANASQVYSN